MAEKAKEGEVIEVSVPIAKIRAAPYGSLAVFQDHFPWVVVSRNAEQVKDVTHIKFDLSAAPTAAAAEAALIAIPGKTWDV